MRTWLKITTLCCKRSKIGSHLSLTSLMTVLSTASCHSHQEFRKSVMQRSLPRKVNCTCRFWRITVLTQRRTLMLISYRMKFHRSASANNSSRKRQSPRYSVKPWMQLNRAPKRTHDSSGRASSPCRNHLNSRRQSACVYKQRWKQAKPIWIKKMKRTSRTGLGQLSSPHSILVSTSRFVIS